MKIFGSFGQHWRTKKAFPTTLVCIFQSNSPQPYTTLKESHTFTPIKMDTPFFGYKSMSMIELLDPIAKMNGKLSLYINQHKQIRFGIQHSTMMVDFESGIADDVISILETFNFETSCHSLYQLLPQVLHRLKYGKSALCLHLNRSFSDKLPIKIVEFTKCIFPKCTLKDIVTILIFITNNRYFHVMDNKIYYLSPVNTVKKMSSFDPLNEFWPFYFTQNFPKSRLTNGIISRFEKSLKAKSLIKQRSSRIRSSKVLKTTALYLSQVIDVEFNGIQDRVKKYSTTVDLTHLQAYAIDSRQGIADDAICFDEITGIYYIHIVNIAQFIEKESMTEKRAKSVWRTKYPRPNSKFGIFPAQLERFFDLTSNGDHFVLTTSFKITPELDISDLKIFESKISSCKPILQESAPTNPIFNQFEYASKVLAKHIALQQLESEGIGSNVVKAFMFFYNHAIGEYVHSKLGSDSSKYFAHSTSQFNLKSTSPLRSYPQFIVQSQFLSLIHQSPFKYDPFDIQVIQKNLKNI
jgi:hypothetical protein